MQKCDKIKLTKKEAAKSLDEAKKERRKTWGDTFRQEKRIYYCSGCRSWHLTSMPLEDWMFLKKKEREDKVKAEIKNQRELLAKYLQNQQLPSPKKN